MTVLAPGVEEILEKLVRIARGNPALVQEALGRASVQSDRPPTLEQVVDYILTHREQVPQPAR
jgi:hypothetical protein